MRSNLVRAFRQIRLVTGFCFIVALLVLARPSGSSLLAATPLFLGGLWLRAWAAGHLVKRKSLTRSGPYAHTRNPLYLGSLLLLLGACTGSHAWMLWAVFIPLYVVIHVVVVRSEQELAARNFPGEFEGYAAAVPAFWPRLRATGGGGGRWSAAQYLRNGEYNAGLGVVAAAVFLILRLGRRI